MPRKRTLIEAVPVVTEEHGRVFAQEWFDASCAAPDMVEAFAKTEILTWPADDREAQGTYHDIEGDILEDTFAIVKEQIADAFVAVANRALGRERRRPVVTAAIRRR
jgi:hypothetical protein